MKGFKPGCMPRKAKMANGGMVRGPGTGTSDEVPAVVPKGSYIMPADSTKAIGAATLGELGKPVPVQLSNGEYQIPPEQVHAVGVQALNRMRDATHTPAPAAEMASAARGFRPVGSNPSTSDPEPRMFFADGGAVGDSQMANAARSAVGFIAGAFPGTATAMRESGNDIADAYHTGGIGAAVGRGFRNTMVPVVGLADDVAGSAAKALDPFAQGLKTLVTGDATPIGQDKPASTPAPAVVKANGPAAPQNAISTPLAQAGGPSASAVGFQPAGVPARRFADPYAGSATSAAPPGSAPASSAQQIAPGVYKHGDGQYSDNPAGMDSVASTGSQAGAVSSMPMVARGFAPNNSAAASQQTGPASVIIPDTGGYGILDKGYQQARGLRMDAQTLIPGAAKAYRDFMAEQAAAPNRMAEAQMRAQSDLARTTLQENAATSRNNTDNATRMADVQVRGFDAMANNALRNRQEALDEQVKGIQIRSAQRLEALQSQYENATNDADRANIAREIRAMSGKPDPALKDSFMAVGGGQEVDPTSGQMRNVPQRLIDLRTGKEVGGNSSAAAPAAPMDISKRVVGQVYVLPDGSRGRWTGDRWGPV